MQLPAHIFREYDIRGVVGRDLDANGAKTIARAFAAYLGRARVRRAVIGHDNRVSSPELYDAAIAGLTGVGCDAVGIGSLRPGRAVAALGISSFFLNMNISISWSKSSAKSHASA